MINDELRNKLLQTCIGDDSDSEKEVLSCKKKFIDKLIQADKDLNQLGENILRLSCEQSKELFIACSYLLDITTDVAAFNLLILIANECTEQEILDKYLAKAINCIEKGISIEKIESIFNNTNCYLAYKKTLNKLLKKDNEKIMSSNSEKASSEDMNALLKGIEELVKEKNELERKLDSANSLISKLSENNDEYVNKISELESELAQYKASLAEVERQYNLEEDFLNVPNEDFKENLDEDNEEIQDSFEKHADNENNGEDNEDVLPDIVSDKENEANDMLKKIGLMFDILSERITKLEDKLEDKASSKQTVKSIKETSASKEYFKDVDIRHQENKKEMVKPDSFFSRIITHFQKATCDIYESEFDTMQPEEQLKNIKDLIFMNGYSKEEANIINVALEQKVQDYKTIYNMLANKEPAGMFLQLLNNREENI